MSKGVGSDILEPSLVGVSGDEVVDTGFVDWAPLPKKDTVATALFSYFKVSSQCVTSFLIEWDVPSFATFAFTYAQPTGTFTYFDIGHFEIGEFRDT